MGFLFPSATFIYLLRHLFPNFTYISEPHIYFCAVFISYIARGAWLSSDQSSCTRSKADRDKIDQHGLSGDIILAHSEDFIEVLWRINCFIEHKH